MRKFFTCLEKWYPSPKMGVLVQKVGVPVPLVPLITPMVKVYYIFGHDGVVVRDLLEILTKF